MTNFNIIQIKWNKNRIGVIVSTQCLKFKYFVQQANYRKLIKIFLIVLPALIFELIRETLIR